MIEKVVDQNPQRSFNLLKYFRARNNLAIKILRENKTEYNLSLGFQNL